TRAARGHVLDTPAGLLREKHPCRHERRGRIAATDGSFARGRCARTWLIVDARHATRGAPRGATRTRRRHNARGDRRHRRVRRERRALHARQPSHLHRDPGATPLTFVRHGGRVLRVVDRARARNHAGRAAIRGAGGANLMKRPRVLIIGGGFGGLYAARELRDTLVDVTLVDRTNHHVFQPLLYQVATATLAPSDIAVPIRWLLRKQRNTEVLMAEVASIDPKARVVVCRDGTEVHY